MEILKFDCIGDMVDEFSEGTLTNGIPFIDKPNAMLFKTGRHKGKPYTEADLDKMVSQFSAPQGETDWSVPVQVDHSESARDTVGHIRSVHRDGNLLKGTLRVVGTDAVDRVKGGTYKKLSLGIRGNMSLHHVAITPHPYITDAQLYHEEEPPVADKPTETPKAEPAAPPTPAPAAPVTQTFKSAEQLQAEFTEQTRKYEAREAAQEARMKALEDTIRFGELTAKVDTFSANRKTVAAMRTEELELLKTFSEEQLELYEKLKAKQPALVSYDVIGFQESAKPGDDTSVAEDEKWANEQAAANGYTKDGGSK